MDLIQSTSSRANAEEIALALKSLGVKKVRVSGSLITAQNNGVEVSIRLCRENTIFAWWMDSSGEQCLGYSFCHVREALGLSSPELRNLRCGTVVTRILVDLGLCHRTTRTKLSQFCVDGDYNQHHERVATRVVFFGQEARDAVSENWDKIQRVLALTPFTFHLHKMGQGHMYLSTRS